MTSSPRYRWTSACRSEAGLRERNEDACLERPERGLWAVADGMGGHAIGDYASAKVVEALDTLGPPEDLAAVVAEARTQLQAVNRHLRAVAAARGVHRIGSTVAALLAHDDRYACLWAGDSRVYLYRDAHLQQLTRDHSQVEALKAQGHLFPEDLPGRAPHNVITRAVGAEDLLDIDETGGSVRDGDLFLLCSDGLSTPLGDEDIAAALLPGCCRQAATALVDLALRRGSRDNVSVIVARAEDVWSADRTLLNPAL